MPSFKLNVSFTNEQLETLYTTGTNVVLGKSQAGNPPNVAWQVFRPLQGNTITWEEEYGLYSSTTDIVNGAVINQMSTVPIPAAMSQMYTLQPSGVISGPVSGGMPNAYALENKYSERSYMTEGLSQNATVNGIEISNNAVLASSVILNSLGVFSPSSAIFIWLQSQVRSNSIVTFIPSPMTELRFGGGVDDISVTYDSSTGRFISSSKGLQMDAVNHHDALL